MNQALQRRHEQLERWKQNEASIDTISSKENKNKERKNRISHNNENSNKDNIRNNRLGNTVKFSNGTLFLAACANGDVEECERLLKAKLVDINTTTNDGLTGLHEAAIAGNRKMVEYLIKNGAQVNCADNEGWTPLHAAASLGQTEVVEALLLNNADPTLVNCENVLAYDLSRNDQVRTLIGSELREENLELLRLQERRLIEYDISRWLKTGIYDERSHPITNANVLHVLASKGHIELMRRLLESEVLRRQINIDARDTEGFTPLIAAAYWGQTGIVQLLIEHGANALVQSNQGYRFEDFLESSFAALMKDLFYTNQLEKKHDLSKVSSRTSRLNNLNAIMEKTNNLDIVSSSTTDLSPSKYAPSDLDNDITVTLKKPIVPPHSSLTTKALVFSPPSSPIAATGDIYMKQVQNDSIASSPGCKSPASESETQRRAHAKRVRETRRSTQGISAADVLKAKVHSDHLANSNYCATLNTLDAHHDGNSNSKVSLVTMSFHNPYLSASRPSSSFTRSSRSSKRNDPSANKSNFLNRSRSSMALGASGQSLLSAQTAPSSSYHLDTSSAYIPGGNWNRSSSTNRLTRNSSSSTATSTAPTSASTFVPGLRPSTSQSNFLTQQQQVSTSSPIFTPAGVSDVSNIRRGPNDLNSHQIASGTNSRSSSVLSLDHPSSVDDDENLDSNKSSQLQQLRNNTKSLSYQQNPDRNHSSSDGIFNSDSTISGRSISLESSLSVTDTLTQSELRRSYKELLIENDKLTKQLRDYEDNEKRRNQDWSREKRQMQRKISELEEENKQLEQWKHESQRLKDENSSLLRVISKISK